MSSPNSAHQSSPSDQRYSFIALSGRRVDSDTKRKIHSHAQANFRRQTAHHRRNPTTVEIDVSSLLLQPPENTLKEDQVIPVPSTILDASRSDPFDSWRLPGGRRAHRLWDHVYDGTCAKFRTLIAIGFIDLVRSSIALSQLLSASAWHLVHWCRCEDDVGEDAKYSLISTRALQQRLTDVVTGTSNEVVTAVLASAAYANLIKEPHLFQIHMDGLAQILRHKGGENALDSSPELRLSMFFIETNGRFRQDVTPSFRPPYHILAQHTRLTLPMEDISQLSAQEELGNIEESRVVKHLCGYLRELNRIVDEECSSRELWTDPLFRVYHLSPILHSFLSAPRATLYDGVHQRRRECFRLASILYVCNLWAKFDFDPGMGMLYGTKLQLMVSSQDMLPIWEDSKMLFIWILSVAACSATLFDDLRREFIALLSVSVRAAGVGSFRQFFTMIDGFLWSISAFGQELRALEGQMAFEI